jgi:hypothetical protein
MRIMGAEPGPNRDARAGVARLRGMSGLRRKVAATRIAPLAALPMRLQSVARYDAQVLGRRNMSTCLRHRVLVFTE